MWNARNLTLFGRVMIIKALRLSHIIHSASNLDVPVGTVGTLKKKLFNFIWRNKKDKIKRTGLYKDLEKGRIGMVDVDLMFKALRLGWIPRLMTARNRNWCTIPNHFFTRMGDLNVLLRCNYDTKYLEHIL